MVENSRFTAAGTFDYIHRTFGEMSGLDGHIVTSYCRSLSKSFGTLSNVYTSSPLPILPCLRLEKHLSIFLLQARIFTQKCNARE